MPRKPRHKNVFGRMFDGSDRSVEWHSVLVGVAFLVLCVFQGFSLWHTKEFNPAAFGEALAVILGGGGAAAIGQGALLYAHRQSQDASDDDAPADPDK